MRRAAMICLVFLALGWLAFAGPPAPEAPALSGEGEAHGHEPVPGMVTVLDFTAEGCPPCRMMAPTLAEIREEYEGRAAIIAVDVLEHPEAATQRGVRVVPTLIFFDAGGNERARHVGLMRRQEIVDQLSRIGAPPARP